MDKRPLSSPVSIYALGGLGEVGKNMYCVENDNTIIILDCGVRFPSVDLPGIDYIIPDFTHLKNNRNKIKALVLNHKGVLGFHGFYMDSEKKDIRFDVVFSFGTDVEATLNQMNKEILALYPDHRLIISPDVDLSD